MDSTDVKDEDETDMNGDSEVELDEIC